MSLILKIILASILIQSSVSIAANKPDLRVAVIDTGLDITDPRFKSHLCSTGHKDFTGEGIQDTNGHGSHVVGSIIRNAGDKGYCLLIYKFYSDHAKPDANRGSYELALLEAAANAKVVNYSGGGPKASMIERLTIEHQPNVIFVAAAGNDSDNTSEKAYYPASYPFPNVVSVGSLHSFSTEGCDEDSVVRVNPYLTGCRADSSNYGPMVKAWEIGEGVVSTCLEGKTCTMSGTSMATAIHTGRLVKELVAKGDKNLYQVITKLDYSR